MQIIVVGCGKVGRNIVTQLIKEDNNVTVIDTNADLVRTMSTNYDVMGIVGNGSSFNILREADLKHTDMLIAVTESDEVNLLTCVIAKLNNERCHTIARVRSPHYSVESHYLQKGLNLSMIINPELEAAKEMARLLNFPTAIDIFSFAKDRIDMLRFRVPKNSLLIGRSLRQVGQMTTNNLLVCIIERNSEIIVPNGDTVISSGDILTIIAMPNDVEEFFRKIGVKTNKADNVMIVGGGATSYYLAKLLVTHGVSVTIIEKDSKVIQLFEKNILPYFPHKEKIHIVKQDAFLYFERELRNEAYDYIFVDIYHTPEDALGMYLRFKSDEKKYNYKPAHYWIEESILCLLRRYVLTLIEEYYQGMKEEDYEEIVDEETELLQKLYRALKKQEYSSIKDILSLLSDEGLKELAKNI